MQAATGPTIVQAAQVDTAVPELQPSTSGTTQRRLTQLPTFSERVSGVLKSGDVAGEMDGIVDECAFHIMANGDMTDRGAYEDFGRMMFAQYPCISHSGVNPWVRFVVVSGYRYRNIEVGKVNLR